MRAYYLERPLTNEEIGFVSDALDAVIEQVRIPYVLPAPDPKHGYADRPKFDDALLSKHLRAAGIEHDRGQQVILVVPNDMHWHVALLEAIYKETGFYPYLVQTEEHRESIGNPGSLRIIDAHGLMG